MTPSNPTNDVVYGNPVNSELFGNLSSIKTALLLRPYKGHLFWGELGLWKLVASRISSLFKHVIHVVFGGSSKEMFRVAATRSVARMANAFAFWNRTVRKLVSDSVNVIAFFVDEQHPITSCDSTSLPQPTLVRGANFDSAPKSCFPRQIIGYEKMIRVSCVMVGFHKLRR